jgi:hypothetical protein
MFRDRVVSMEQTLEGGEKHLPLLRELCREAFPELEFREHALDHERDLFVMDFVDAGGARTRVCWTRMVLYDAERIPTLTGDPAGALRSKIVEFLRARAGKSEILVTFRHLEDGWTDTPEPRRDGRRRRRGGRGGSRGPERGAPDRRPTAAGERRPGGAPAAAPAQRGPAQRERAPAPRGPAPRGPAAPRPASGEPRASGPAEPGAAGPAGKRRRRRRRRGGRGPGGGPPSSAGPAPSVPRP